MPKTWSSSCKFERSSSKQFRLDVWHVADLEVDHASVGSTMVRDPLLVVILDCGDRAESRGRFSCKRQVNSLSIETEATHWIV